MRKSNWIVSRLGVKMTIILETTTYNPTHQQLWGYRSRWFAAPIFNSARSICKKNLRILPNVSWSILKRFKTHSNVLETSRQCDDSFSITSCDTFKFPLKSWRSKKNLQPKIIRKSISTKYTKPQRFPQTLLPPVRCFAPASWRVAPVGHWPRRLPRLERLGQPRSGPVGRVSFSRLSKGER